MIRPLVHRMKRAGIRSRVRKALDAGVGVYNRTWPLGQAGVSPSQGKGPAPAEVKVLAAQVLDWCRLAMGQMRKPYGLDYVNLAIAVMDAQEQELAQVNFGVLRPQEFYGDDSVARRIEEALAQWEEEGLLRATDGDRAPRLATLLFSWGDLTRELMLAG